MYFTLSSIRSLTWIIKYRYCTVELRYKQNKTILKSEFFFYCVLVLLPFVASFEHVEVGKVVRYLGLLFLAGLVGCWEGMEG